MRVSSRIGVLVLVAGVLALALAACGDGTGPDAEKLTVVPAGPLEMAVGDTVTLRVGPVPSAGGGVAFTVSDPRVLRVSADGLVTAQAAGTATITVTSAQRSGETLTVVVKVRPLAFSIESIRTALGVTADPNAIRGEIVVGTSTPSPMASRVEILLDTAIVCVRELPASSGAFGAVTALPDAAAEGCVVDTARFDTVTGAARFRNGTIALGARVVGAGGQVLATAPSRQLKLANPNALFGRVSASRQAADSQGRVWLGGDLTITAIPILYEPGAALGTVSFTYALRGRGLFAMPEIPSPFQARIPAGTAAGVLDEAVRVYLTSRTAAGGEGPSGSTPPIRYDHLPPVAGSLTMPEWVNGTFAFSRLLTPASAVDSGVGGLTARFYAGSPELRGSQLIEQGVPVSTGSDLVASTAFGYRLAADVCDALGNCTVIDGPTFGVDRQAPVVTAVNLPDRALNPGDHLTVLLADDRSGFPPGTVEVKSIALIADLTTPGCGPMLEGMDLPGRLIGGSCLADSMGIRIPVPQRTPGYYTYTVVPMDRAGNRGDTLRRVFLVDLAPPVIRRVALPAQVVSGEEISVVVDATDDSDLIDSRVRLLFPWGDRTLGLPLAPTAVLGTPFDERLTLAASDTFRFAFIRSLSFASASGAGRTTVLVEGVEAQVTDAAGRSGRTTRTISPATYGGNVSVADPFTAVTSVAQALSALQVCSAGCGSGDPISTSVTVRVSGESGLFSFGRMYLFRQAVSDGATTLVGSSATAAITDTGTQRTFTYTFTVTPPAGLEGEFRLFAVGVTSSGNGLKTSDLGVTFFTR